MRNLYIIGGFLGSGKTAFVTALAKHLINHGERVGIVSNGHAPVLVDTAYFEPMSIPTREVTGGGFGESFINFNRAVNDLFNVSCSTVICESLGDTADLAATALRPLKQYMPTVKFAPLTVILDPERFCSFQNPGEIAVNEDLVYLWERQLSEADIIVLNKSDRLEPPDLAALLDYLHGTFPDTVILPCCSTNGRGISEYLNAVNSFYQTVGARVLDVDYARYSKGSALMTWYNGEIKLRAAAPTDWSEDAYRFFETIHQTLKQEKCAIGHLKMILNARGSTPLMMNVADVDAEVDIHGKFSRPTTEAKILFNARAQLAGAVLSELVDAALQSVFPAYELVVSNVITPSPNKPTARSE